MAMSYNYIMTLPDERYRALKQTESFLMSLCDPKATPRIPSAVRRRAGALLKHYPHSWHLWQLAESRPDILTERMEPLTRMVMSYEEETKHDDAS